VMRGAGADAPAPYCIKCVLLLAGQIKWGLSPFMARELTA
jgi:hypothetical protein